ncbi:unnamed protein product [Ilex paraguariensis]|uniref:Cytochrome c oxidase subunit 6b-1 n=1 Tax=Ilex paraguariensis TaxID=185542 RepID=A0ABC8T3Q7_9AQUA
MVLDRPLDLAVKLNSSSFRSIAAVVITGVAIDSIAVAGITISNNSVAMMMKAKVMEGAGEAYFSAMAEIDSGKTLSLHEQYLLKGKENEEKLVLGPKPAEEEVKNPVSAASDEVVAQKTEEIPVSVESSEVSQAGAAEEGSEASDVDTGKSTENAAAEESGGSTDQETPVDQEESELSTEIKLETAPADFRFPTTNQTRHCFTRYVEYHRCVVAKGEGAPECDKFAKYYRSLCPGEWIDRWNEQRENGSFPGPL